MRLCQFKVAVVTVVVIPVPCSVLFMLPFFELSSRLLGGVIGSLWGSVVKLEYYLPVFPDKMPVDGWCFSSASVVFRPVYKAEFNDSFSLVPGLLRVDYFVVSLYYWYSQVCLQLADDYYILRPLA